MTGEPVAFVVHGLPHLAAALAAGAESGRPIVAISAPGASAYAGPAWFAALAAEGGAAYPDVALTAILDCGDRAGDALAALKAGLTRLIFTGNPVAGEKLAAIARGYGAEIMFNRPDAVDLLGVRDPARAARTACNCLQRTMALGY
jgi:hypothetical protein